jgi:hypothetical protein
MDMPIPVLKRQTADDAPKKLNGIPLLRQYDIPPEMEPVSSPIPTPLDFEEVSEEL